MNEKHETGAPDTAPAVNEASSDLARREQDFAMVSQAARLGIWTWDVASGQVEWSDEVYKIYGVERDDFTLDFDSFLALILPPDRAIVKSALERGFRSEDGRYWVQHRLIRPSDGVMIWIQGQGQVFRDAAGQPKRMVGTTTDVTAIKAIEQQLLHAQKMDSIGRLAGGVAHDLNNLLTVILGEVELARLDADGQPELAESLTGIREAADRATTLTRQLMTFARQQPVSLAPSDLGALLNKSARLLGHMAGPKATVAIECDTDLRRVEIDPAQFEQLVMNLVSNARDAMSDGGEVRIQIHHRTLGAAEADAFVELEAGDHVLMTVTDDGEGVDESTLSKAFEPFFTTRSGGGGLGLSICYGIVRSANGAIRLERRDDKGCVVSVYFPAHGAASVDSDGDGDGTDQVSETILLAEDDPRIRELTRRNLAGLGYTVLTARDGQHATEVALAFEGPIHLLLSDVVMPRMSGPKLAAWFSHARPDARTLFISGYTADHFGDDGPAGAPLLAKPFTNRALAAKVREILRG